jgi:hypothetical protein
VFGFVWWALYCLLAIWLQYFFPGLDFLAPALVVSMQEENWWRSSVWLLLAAVLLQDGMGSLGFGYSLAWYGTLVFAYQLGRRFFDPRSVGLVILLGVFLGWLHFSLTFSLIRLEGMNFALHHVVWESVAQGVVFPAFWFFIHKFFPERLKEDERTA